MNITNSQIKRIRTAMNNMIEGLYPPLLNDAYQVLNELEAKRKTLNERTAKNLAQKRAKDPLYGRSTEYKQKRIEKAKQILALYGEEK